MVLDVIINDASISVQIDKPLKPDLDAIYSQIEQFALSKGTDIKAFDLRGLVLKMIKGIAGCEHGCPADAKGLEYRGYKGFKVHYVEGGILTDDVSLPEPEVETTVRQRVERRRLFSNVQRVIERQDDDVSADANAPGACGNGSQDRKLS